MLESRALTMIIMYEGGCDGQNMYLAWERRDTFCPECLRGEHVDGRLIIKTKSSGKN
jgi:hypothetical protein